MVCCGAGVECGARLKSSSAGKCWVFLQVAANLPNEIVEGACEDASLLVDLEHRGFPLLCNMFHLRCYRFLSFSFISFRLLSNGRPFGGAAGGCRI